MRASLASACCVTGLLLGACWDRGEDAAAKDDPAAVRQAMVAIESALASARVDDALKIAQRLVEVAPASAQAHELLGRALIAKSTEQRDAVAAKPFAVAAWAAYSRAIAVGEPSAGLLNAAAVTAQGAGATAAAVELFFRAEKADPQSAQHPLFAGLALHSLARDDEARAALMRAALIDPDSPWPVAALSSIALAHGDAPQALELVRQARQLDPTCDELRVTEAKALRALDRHAEVLSLLLALPESSRFTEAVTWEIASAHAAMGDRGSAARARAAFAERSLTAQSALDAATAWDAAGDAVQAASWRRVAAERR